MEKELKKDKIKKEEKKENSQANDKDQRLNFITIFSFFV